MLSNLIVFTTIFITYMFALELNIKPELSIIPCNDSWKANWEFFDCVSSNSSYIFFEKSNENCALSSKDILFNDDAISILDFIWTFDSKNHWNQSPTFVYDFTSTSDNIRIYITVTKELNDDNKNEYYLGIEIDGLYDENGDDFQNINYPLNIRNGSVFLKIALIYKNSDLNAMIKINDEAWKEIVKSIDITIDEGSISLVNEGNTSNHADFKIQSLATYFITQDNKTDTLENNEKILDVIVYKINSEKSKCDSESNNLNTVKMVTDLLTSTTLDSKSYDLNNNSEESVTPLFNTTTSKGISKPFNNNSYEVVKVLPNSTASHFKYTNIILMILGICFSVNRRYNV